MAQISLGTVQSTSFGAPLAFDPATPVVDLMGRRAFRINVKQAPHYQHHLLLLFNQRRPRFAQIRRGRRRRRRVLHSADDHHGAVGKIGKTRQRHYRPPIHSHNSQLRRQSGVMSSATERRGEGREVGGNAFPTAVRARPTSTIDERRVSTRRKVVFARPVLSTSSEGLRQRIDG